MNHETAKGLLGWWSREALVGPSSLKDAINTLVRGKLNPFVEACIRRREALKGRRSG
jgi:hypothetical protein